MVKERSNVSLKTLRNLGIATLTIMPEDSDWHRVVPIPSSRPFHQNGLWVIIMFKAIQWTFHTWHKLLKTHSSSLCVCREKHPWKQMQQANSGHFANKESYRWRWDGSDLRKSRDGKRNCWYSKEAGIHENEFRSYFEHSGLTHCAQGQNTGAPLPLELSDAPKS